MNVKQTIFRVLAVFVAVAVAACTQIPLRSLWALRKLDLAQVDGAHLRALIYLPEGASTLRDAIKVPLKIERSNGSSEVLEETLVLRPDRAALPAARPAAPAGPGHWVALTLDAQEQHKLASLRQRAQLWRAADGPEVKRKLSANVSAQFCSLSPAMATAGDLTLTVWLRWKAEQEDLLVLDSAKLKDMDDKGAAEKLPACD
jgi:hypothetical protein